MTLRWSLTRVAETTGGTLIGDQGTKVTGVTTDSRSVAADTMFVALRGDRYDGHQFVAEAMDAGAVAVLVERGRSTAVPRIEVDDTVTALRDLAAGRRDEMEVPVVAVTGSTGKTSTKDLLVAMLPGAHGSRQSFNNEIGVPLTVLEAPDDMAHLVMEVGARSQGDIRWLTPVVRPDVAIITNLGVVHLESFGSEEQLADAKWELVEGLTNEGVAVLPADEPRLRRNHRGSTMTFGIDVDADVMATNVRLDSDLRPEFELETPAGGATVQAPFAGRHQATNVVAAIAAGLALGVPLAPMLDQLSAAKPSPWRMEIHRGTYTVVNDAYNANPDSVEDALRSVAAMPGRHVAVLGRMAELGPVTTREHERIGALVAELGYAALVTVGDDQGLAAAAGSIARPVDSVDSAAAVLDGYLRRGDVVLVKASRAVGLESLAARLAERAKQ